MLDQKWLANGTAVLVLDAGSGEPTIGDGNNGQQPNPDYRPALVAVLATEYHEPGQVLDADPLADEDTAALTSRTDGATQPGIVPGELRGPAPAPQAVPGPATPVVTTRSTAAEDPNVTAPGSAAAVGGVGAAQIIATLRDLTTRAEAGDGSARAELEQLAAAFDADVEEVGLGGSSGRDVPADRIDTASRVDATTGADVTTGETVTDGGSRAADVPETAPGGNGEAAGSAQGGPASATGAGDGPATA